MTSLMTADTCTWAQTWSSQAVGVTTNASGILAYHNHSACNMMVKTSHAKVEKRASGVMTVPGGWLHDYHMGQILALPSLHKSHGKDPLQRLQRHGYLHDGVLCLGETRWHLRTFTEKETQCKNCCWWKLVALKLIYHAIKWKAAKTNCAIINVVLMLF